MEQTAYHRQNTELENGSDTCPECGGIGYILWRDEKSGERFSRTCRCEIIRQNRRRLERSGLSGLVDRYTFERYQTPEPWQKAAKASAERYLTDWHGKWFFIGGTSGAGKTHLCTAICGELIEAGIPVRYMQWRSDIPPIKAVVNDAEAYKELLDPLKKIKALYIDDFLKGAVKEGDRNIAFELLNHRYIDARKITIISSELTLDKIIQWDTGTGGRIGERAKGFIFNLSEKTNWRLK